MPRSRSTAIQSERARRRSPRALTSPANWIAPPNSSNFSVRVVLPASGCEMIAKVRRREISSVRVLINPLQLFPVVRPLPASAPRASQAVDMMAASGLCQLPPLSPAHLLPHHLFYLRFIRSRCRYRPTSSDTIRLPESAAVAGALDSMRLWQLHVLRGTDGSAVLVNCFGGGGSGPSVRSTAGGRVSDKMRRDPRTMLRRLR